MRALVRSLRRRIVESLSRQIVKASSRQIVKSSSRQIVKSSNRQIGVAGRPEAADRFPDLTIYPFNDSRFSDSRSGRRGMVPAENP